MNKLIIAATLAAFTTAASADTVRMGTEGAYPPYNFLNDAGEVDGLEREIGDKLCEIAGLDCVWVVNDWDSIIPNLVSGNYDTIIAGMSITDERDEVIDFTQEYIPSDPSAYMAMAGAAGSGDVVATQASTIQASYVASSGATVVEFATADETVAAVRSGEVDSVLADRAFLADIVADSNGELVFVGDDVSIGGGVGIGVRESDADLKAALNAAIDQMKADGSLNEILKRWLEIDAGY
ncbi:MAG: transporter substrate-binding domain-containing protein [Alphaproteobacteria bacterium]